MANLTTDTSLLGEYLARIRYKKGLSSRDLSRASGVDHATILSIEAGRTASPRFHAIIALAKALEIPVENFAAAAVGQDPDKIVSGDAKELGNILSSVITGELRRRGILE